MAHCIQQHHVAKLWIFCYMEIPRAEFTAQLEYAKHWLTFNVEGEETSKIKLHVAQKSLTWFLHQRQTRGGNGVLLLCKHATISLRTEHKHNFHMNSCNVSQWATRMREYVSGELNGGSSFCHFSSTSRHNTVEKQLFLSIMVHSCKILHQGIICGTV